jgi:ribosomal protein S8
MLLAYKKRYHHVRVPLDEAKPWQELAEWVHTVRLMRRRTRQDLSVERIETLDKIGFQWKFDGETLDSTEGLLTEKALMQLSGISCIHKYRKNGLIKPVGYAVTRAGVGPYYHLRQIDELKEALGVTLDSTVGLLSEADFRAKSGLTKIESYRERGVIVPYGYAIASGSRGVGTYYHPRQIAELKKALGITLKSTKGLLTEKAMRRIVGASRMVRCRKRGLIKPVGYAITKAGVGPYYHPRQVTELKKRLGITLESTTGLINEKQFATASGLTGIARYRQKEKIKPVGYAAAGPAISAFYHPRQIKELKKALGITLDSTKGLLNEYAARRIPGLSQIRQHRLAGRIKPIGWALGGMTGLKPYYHPRQIKQLKKTLGITIDSTKGLINETQFAKALGVSSIVRYRENGLIKPVGRASTRGGVGFVYHPRQIKQLKKKLGITLTSTKGLLNETQFGKASGLTNVGRYRKRGLVTPVGHTVTHAGVSPFYHPRQVKALQRRLAAKQK